MATESTARGELRVKAAVIRGACWRGRVPQRGAREMCCGELSSGVLGSKFFALSAVSLQIM